jgi:type II restriction enzyme
MVVAEAVVSTGILNESRLEQLGELTSASTRLGFKVEFLTAFPTRTLLRRFVDQIAWGTVVWIASEPNNLILFQKRLPGSKSE